MFYSHSNWLGFSAFDDRSLVHRDMCMKITSILADLNLENTVSVRHDIRCFTNVYALKVSSVFIYWVFH